MIVPASTRFGRAALVLAGRAGIVLLIWLGSSRAGAQQSLGGNGWSDRVSRTQAAQPHWITPVVTVTPRLEQEFRYDISHQQRPGGDTPTILGGGKGLELIPTERVEIILGIPPYVRHSQPGLQDGWGDFSFLVKYRLAAGHEEHGNYIATVFLGATLPTGTNRNGAEHAVITPTLALGKAGEISACRARQASVCLPQRGTGSAGPCSTTQHFNTGSTESSGLNSKSTPRSGRTENAKASRRSFSRPVWL